MSIKGLEAVLRTEGWADVVPAAPKPKGRGQDDVMVRVRRAQKGGPFVLVVSVTGELLVSLGAQTHVRVRENRAEKALTLQAAAPESAGAVSIARLGQESKNRLRRGQIRLPAWATMTTETEQTPAQCEVLRWKDTDVLAIRLPWALFPTTGMARAIAAAKGEG